MKSVLDRVRGSRVAFVMQVAALAAMPAAGRGEDAKTLAGKQGEDAGWIELFDGKTLEGWHKNPQRIGHGTGGDWRVEEGAIVGAQDPPGNGGILLTDKSYDDFELSIDMRPDWGIDSGLFLRSNDRGQCFQMMVDYHQGGNVGHIYGEGVGGFNNRTFELFGETDGGKRLIRLSARPVEHSESAEFSISPEQWLQTWKIDGWNTARVRMLGNPPKITTWLNGAKVTEFDGGQFTGPNYDQRNVADILGAKGSIALQVHGGSGAWPAGAKCRWKNVRIRPL